MKNATAHTKKIKKLLSGMKKVKPSDEPRDRIELLVLAALQENATLAKAQRALSTFRKEFVDLNELRVAQPSELVELLGMRYPGTRQAAERVGKTLNAVFYHANDLTVEFMETLGKRDLRKLMGKLGFTPYITAIMLLEFGGHAIPVDQDLVDALEIDGMIEPGSTVAQVEGFLESHIAHKDALSAHAALRAFVETHSEALNKRRKIAAKAAAEAEEIARKEAQLAAEAEAKAAAERAAIAEREAAEKLAAEQAAEAEAKAAKKAAKAAARKAAKLAAAKPAATAKKTPKKTTKKVSEKPTAKKAVTKTAKKVVKKTAPRTAKKAAKKATKKTVKKVAKKVAKKSGSAKKK
jgi:endonuclease III